MTTIDLLQYPETEAYRATLQTYEDAHARHARMIAQRASEAVVLAALEEVHTAGRRSKAAKWALKDKLKERYNCEAVNAAIHDFEMRFKPEADNVI